MCGQSMPRKFRITFWCTATAEVAVPVLALDLLDPEDRAHARRVGVLHDETECSRYRPPSHRLGVRVDDQHGGLDDLLMLDRLRQHDVRVGDRALRNPRRERGRGERVQVLPVTGWPRRGPVENVGVEFRPRSPDRSARSTTGPARAVRHLRNRWPAGPHWPGRPVGRRRHVEPHPRFQVQRALGHRVRICWR